MKGEIGSRAGVTEMMRTRSVSMSRPKNSRPRGAAGTTPLQRRFEERSPYWAQHGVRGCASEASSMHDLVAVECRSLHLCDAHPLTRGEANTLVLRR